MKMGVWLCGLLPLCGLGPAGAAKLLGLKPTTLESRIKKLGLQRPR